ncbi:hypothetical protein ACTXT7_004754 [Hymenolepis weldensis]
MVWFQRSSNWDLLEELIGEERRRNEWKIGQHPLLGLDEFMEDMLQLPIPLCEAENCAQTSDIPHEISTSKASVKVRTDEVDKNESHLRHSSAQTYASSCSTSEQVYAQDQHTAANGGIPRSFRNHHVAKTSRERRKLGFNRPDDSNALSSHAQEANYTSEDLLINFSTFHHCSRGTGRTMFHEVISHNTVGKFPILQGRSTAILQQPLAKQKKLCPVQVQSKTDNTPEQEAPCANQQSSFQYTKCNERCAKLKARGLSDGEILHCLIEENWHSYRSKEVETIQTKIKKTVPYQNHPGKKHKNSLL